MHNRFEFGFERYGITFREIYSYIYYILELFRKFQKRQNPMQILFHETRGVFGKALIFFHSLEKYEKQITETCRVTQREKERDVCAYKQIKYFIVVTRI